MSNEIIRKDTRHGQVLMPSKFLEVGITPDEREVIINHPVDPQSIADGCGWITFSPAQARSLAKLLLSKADLCKP